MNLASAKEITEDHFEDYVANWIFFFFQFVQGFFDDRTIGKTDIPTEGIT
jgi:hypothetical protein